LHPCRTEATREELARQHAELTALGGSLWLWLENRRLDLPFTTAADYAATPANLCPETSSLRNRLVNARASGLAGLLNPRYPRERLFRALNLLLWEASPLPAHRAELQRLLATEATDVAGLTAAYGRLWSRFN